jgi:tetratricopeptide (TPR) repeat protein
MRSRIGVVYLTALLASFLDAAPGAQVPQADPDALYAQRENRTRAREAARIWDGRLQANPKDFEAAWKRARALYWLGSGGEDAAHRQDLEDGITSARRAVAIDERRPEGHFWLAANMGALAESFGLRQGIRYRTPIREALERVRAVDPAFQQGSADRALGRWYFRVPRLFGGSNDKAEAHLKAALAYNPESTATLFFLAELYFETGRRTEARAMLQRVLDAPVHPDWAPEDRQFKRRARTLLDSNR